MINIEYRNFPQSQGREIEEYSKRKMGFLEVYLLALAAISSEPQQLWSNN
jgi:hypothetical protein